MTFRFFNTYHFNRLTLYKKTFEVLFFPEKDAWESCEQKQPGAMVAPRIPDAAAGAAGRRRPSITIQVRPANGVAKSGFV